MKTKPKVKYAHVQYLWSAPEGSKLIGSYGGDHGAGAVIHFTDSRELAEEWAHELAAGRRPHIEPVPFEAWFERDRSDEPRSESEPAEGELAVSEP